MGPRTRIVRARLIAALAAAGVLILALGAGDAHASTASMSGPTAEYVAAPGETNVVTVSDFNGDVDIFDMGVTITAQSPCVSVSPSRVRCPGATAVDLELGDLDDRATVDDSLGFGATVHGGAGADTIFGGPLADTLHGDDGADGIDGGGGGDSLTGDAGDDVLVGGAGEDGLDGGAGNDELGGGADKDQVSGGPDSDKLAGGSGDDSIDGGPGADTLEYVDAEAGGNDALQGGDGDDRFVMGSATNGADHISGGPGLDTADYTSRSAKLDVSAGGGGGDGEAGEGDDVTGDVENLLGGTNDDVLVGTADANTLDGGPGDDHLESGDGVDIDRGGPGGDLVEGGSGDDTIDGGGAVDQLHGGSGDDVIAGGADADTIDGDDGKDQLEGGAPALVGADGGDQLNGGGGNDTEQGGDGDDMLNGGDGDDVLDGEAGTDTATYSDRTVPLTVSLDDVNNDGAAGEKDDVKKTTENIDGGSAVDTLTGDTGPNDLHGGAGEDYIDGGSGGDVVSGGDSGDVIRSRNGTADHVVCGGQAADFVIADPQDQVDLDCTRNRVDTGARQKPRLGTALVVKPPKDSKLQMSPAGIHRLVPLMDKLVLPTGSSIDATKGQVSLTAATVAGHREVGKFNRGRFRFTQSKGRHPITTVALPQDLTCVPARVATAARKRRQLFADVRGHFRTRGRYSTATVRGTKWLTKDTCGGTLTVVQRGTVVVHDRIRKRSITLRAGQHYLARRGNR